MKIEIDLSQKNCAIKVTTADGNIIDIVPDATAVAKETAVKPEPATNAEKENAAPTTGTATPDPDTVETASLSEKIISMKREYERIKKAVYRAKKKLEALAVPGTCPQIVPHVPQNVPGDNLGQGTSAYCNANNINYNNQSYSDQSVISPIPDVANTPAPSTAAEHDATYTPVPDTVAAEYEAAYPHYCLPFVPEDDHSFIPLAQLPEVYRNVVTAWNNLPLTEKLKGLFTDKAKELYALLKQFGEAAVQKAIRTVAECPFLLGKSANSRGWIISFSWLLKPHNMEKVLADKYRDSKKRYQGYDNYNSSYAPWLEEGTDYYNSNCNYNATTTSTTAEALTAHTAATWDDVNENTTTCLLDPAEMFKGVTDLSDQARRGLMNAAAKLGLTKGQVA